MRRAVASVSSVDATYEVTKKGGHKGVKKGHGVGFFANHRQRKD